MSLRTHRRLLAEAAAVTLVIAAAVGIRLQWIDAGAFWVDEAESSINALTILDHGYPADHYLGIPIYENTLVKPWPEHQEYEFKDLSYSDSGIAIYHGWLPLYSIAASFALHGIDADKPAGNLPAQRDLAEHKRRTRAARLPSVVFGAIFLALCYLGGVLLYGRDAGWTALLMAAVMTFHIGASIQARYYSAVVTLSTAAVLVIWLILRSGRTKHYVLGAGVFLLLFFTHLVTFAAAIVMLLLLAPLLLVRQKSSFRNLLLFGAIVLTAGGCWVLATGFLSGLSWIPAAREYLSFPHDLFHYPIARSSFALVYGSFLLLLAAAHHWRDRLPARILVPLGASLMPVALLSTWILTAYATFVLIIPAVSFDTGRMKLPYWGPAVLLGSIACAALARMLSPRLSPFTPPAIAIAISVITGVSMLDVPRSFTDWDRITRLQEHLQQSGLTEHSRIYSVPNTHLVLTFYYGLPVQSIYPVRKSFLDSYQGDIVLIDADVTSGQLSLSPDRLREAAAEMGVDLSEDTARALSLRLRTLRYRAMMTHWVRGSTFPEPVPAFAGPLLTDEHSSVTDMFSTISDLTPIMRGHAIDDFSDWLGIFFYHFVDPPSRMGPNLNYAERLRGSTADILTGAGWVIYRSDCSRSDSESISFNLLD